MALKSVTGGARYYDLINDMQNYLTKTENRDGALTKYAQTYVNTALNQYAGMNNKILTDDLGLEWFMYVGSNKETSREWCKEMAKKKYIHKSEFETVLYGDVNGHQCAIYESTGLPYGMFDDTTVDNLQVNCGGWNCGHKLIPVSNVAVPQKIRDNFEENATFAGQKIDETQRMTKTVKEYKNGGKIDIYQTVDKNVSDYQKVYDCCNYFAKQGEKTVITPRIHYKDPLYAIVYKSLIDTKYYRKCPDFTVGNKFYEYEGFDVNKNPNPIRTFKNMISRGLSQSNCIIIGDCGIGRSWAQRYIYDRAINGVDIQEVWILELTGDLTRLF